MPTAHTAEILSKPEIAILVAVKNNHIVACMEVEKQGNASHIGMLAVNPNLQAAGIGKQMLAYAEQPCRVSIAHPTRLPGFILVIIVVTMPGVYANFFVTIQ